MQNYFGQRSTNFSTSGHPGWNVFCKGKGKMDKKRRTCVVKGGKIGKLVVRCNHHKNFLRVGILSPNKISLRRRHLIFLRKISSRNKLTKYLFSTPYFTIHVSQIHILVITRVVTQSSGVHTSVTRSTHAKLCDQTALAVRRSTRRQSADFL